MSKYFGFLFNLSALVLFFFIGSCSEKPNKLVIYTAFPEEESVFYIRSFEKTTGIHVEWVRLSAGIILTRLETEKSRQSADIWFGGPSDTFIQAEARGLLEPVSTDAAGRLERELRSDMDCWFGIYFGVIGFAVNRELIEKNNLPSPLSWKSLLEPDFKGLVQMAYPYSSGTAFTILASLVQLMGEESAFDYLKLLDKNIQQYTASGSAPVQHAGMGEVAVGVSFSHDILQIKDNGNYPIDLIFPEEGTGYEIGGVAMIKGAKHRDAAIKFLNWCLSGELDKLYSENKSHRLPLSEFNKHGAFPLIDYDNRWAGKNRERLNTKWKELILGSD